MKRHLLISTFLLVVCASGSGQQANNQSSPCPSFPCVVASVSLLNQTESVHQVPIYTPTTTGFFRVSYLEQMGTLGIGTWTFTWNWTDDVRYETFGPFQLSPITYFNAGIPGMRVLAGHPITYSVTGNGVGSYNLFATVEQLQ
jgi:hypothetical protein